MSRTKKYHDQTVKAARETLSLIDDHKLNFIVLAAGMQSGKTKYIACTHELLKEIYPKTLSLYVTAHTHKDFIKQNKDVLGHLEAIDLHCLTLSDRRKDRIKGRCISQYTNDPIIIFFDESHFGDGLEQTIDEWIKRNELHPSRRVVFIGVSATPFSSIERAMGAVCKK